MFLRFDLPAGLPREARATFRAHGAAEFFRLFSLGVTSLAVAVLRRSLGASDLEVTLYTTVLVSSWLFAGFWGVAMEGRPKRPFFLLAAVVSRLGLLFLVLVEGPGWFIAVCAIASAADPCFLIAQNSLLQANYPAQVRATLVSRVSILGRAGLLAGALSGGTLLDAFPLHGTWVLAGGAVVGFLAVWGYSRIPFSARAETSAIHRPTGSSPRALYRDFVRLLRENPAFRRYERNYMIYGLGFMVLQPVEVFLLVDVFDVSFFEYSILRLVLFQAGTIFAFPFAGRLLDRRGPYIAASTAFLGLMAYPALGFLAVHLRAVWFLWVGYLAYGAAMSAVDITWNLCSTHFARDRDSSPFMGIHVFLVGVRGVFGPLLGLWLFGRGGFLAGLGAAFLFFLASGLLMRLSPDRRAEESYAPNEAMRRASSRASSGRPR